MTSATARFLDRSTRPHLLTIVLLTSISALGMNLFLPSLPGMAAYFDADYSTLQLSVGIYLGASAMLQVLIGPISDQMGRRPVILWGLALFMVATLGCILAPTAGIFLFFRMCQAVVAVGMVLGRAAIRDMYDTDRAASMIGYVTMAMAVVPMVAPAIGGALDHLAGWKANFALLMAFGGLVWTLVWLDFGETKSRSGLSLARQFGEYPELLRSPRFWGYVLTAAFASGAFFSYLGGAPYIGTEVFGMDPGRLGLFLGAPALGYMAGNGLSGAYSVRVGTNRMIVLGGLVSTLSTGLSLVLFLVGHGNELVFFGLVTFLGLGNGMTMPNATAGSMSVRPHLAGSASGLGGAIMLGGGAALSVLAGHLLTPSSGAFPLLWLMFVTSVLALGSIFVVIWRERRLRTSGA